MILLDMQVQEAARGKVLRARRTSVDMCLLVMYFVVFVRGE